MNCLCPANKTEAKRIDDWRCPSGSTSPAGSRRWRADLKARAIDPAVGGRRLPAVSRPAAATTARPRSVAAAPDVDSAADPAAAAADSTTTTPHVHVVLLVFAGLFLTMLAVGILSYYRALHGS